MSQRITIIIETQGTAFKGGDPVASGLYCGRVVGRVLHGLATQFEARGYCTPHCIDLNGNRCGSVKVEPMED